LPVLTTGPERSVRLLLLESLTVVIPIDAAAERTIPTMILLPVVGVDPSVTTVVAEFVVWSFLAD
jgi:hypothetical protein